MHNLFLVYFANLYMFRTYLGPLSGGTTVCVQHLVLVILLDDCLLSWMDHLKLIIKTNCCTHTVVPPDDGTRYARNM